MYNVDTIVLITLYNRTCYRSTLAVRISRAFSHDVAPSWQLRIHLIWETPILSDGRKDGQPICFRLRLVIFFMAIRPWFSIVAIGWRQQRARVHHAVHGEYVLSFSFHPHQYSPPRANRHIIMASTREHHNCTLSRPAANAYVIVSGQRWQR